MNPNEHFVSAVCYRKHTSLSTSSASEWFMAPPTGCSPDSTRSLPFSKT